MNGAHLPFSHFPLNNENTNCPTISKLHLNSNWVFMKIWKNDRWISITRYLIIIYTTPYNFILVIVRMIIFLHAFLKHIDDSDSYVMKHLILCLSVLLFTHIRKTLVTIYGFFLLMSPQLIVHNSQNTLRKLKNFENWQVYLNFHHLIKMFNFETTNSPYHFVILYQVSGFNTQVFFVCFHTF